VHAVGGVDLKFESIFFLHRFVDRGGAKILARIAILDGAAGGADVEIVDDQVAGLIFFVASPGVIGRRSSDRRLVLPSPLKRSRGGWPFL